MTLNIKSKSKIQAGEMKMMVGVMRMHRFINNDKREQLEVEKTLTF